MGIKTFYIEETGDIQLTLYVYSKGEGCPLSNNGTHYARQLIEERYRLSDDRKVGLIPDDLQKLIEEKYKWPVHCNCGYEFRPEDDRSILRDAEYISPTGEKMTRRNAPVGAMWDADWLHDVPELCGADGISLHVRTPNGCDWNIDGRGTNCDSPCEVCGVSYHQHKINNEAGHFYKDARPHKCWVRHGDPKSGNVNVDKNGVTCGAGGGSIQIGDYHGHLHNGEFT